MHAEDQQHCVAAERKPESTFFRLMPSFMSSIDTAILSGGRKLYQSTR